MNYAQYLLSGGDLAQPEVENRLGRKEVAELAQRIIQGDLEAATILVENAIKDPENGYISELLASAREAAEQGGDENAQKLWEMVAPVLQQAMQSQSLKCGGKVRAKIKKACSGKKMEKGGEAPIKKEAKGRKPCPCTLHKVGGKLIEVDCNEIPIAKNGTKIVYSLTPAMSTWGWLNTLIPEFTNGIFRPKTLPEVKKPVDGFIQLPDKSYAYRKNGYIYYNNGRVKDPNKKMGSYLYNDVFGDKNVFDDNTMKKYGFTVPVEADKKEETPPLIDKYGRRLQSDGTYAGPTYGQRNAAAVGMLGADGKTGMTVDERKAWMLGAGKDYLASLNGGAGLGFDVANYIGTAAQNRALFNAYKGYAAWKQEQEELNRIKNSRINQRTGQINEGWRGMSDQDLMNYNGKMFDLSDEELQRRAQLLSGSRQAIANNTSRNGDEFYVNGRWVDFDDMTGVSGKSLPGQTPIARFQPFLFNSAFQYRKKGGKIISYADYLK